MKRIPSNLKRVAALILLYLLTSILLTWPTVTHFASALPLGSERVATVPQLNAWTLQWVAGRAADGFQGFWDAPIFYPSQGALAFSDPQALAGLLALPLRGLGPAATYNTVLFLYMTLNGVAAFALFRHLKLSQPVALLGGVWAQALSFLTHERGVLQLQPLFVVALVLLAGLKLLEAPGWRRALALGLALGLSFYLSEYLGLIAALMLAIIILVAMRRAPKALPHLLLAVALATLIALPYLLRQQAILASYGFERSESSVENGSAAIGDYLRPSARTVWAGIVRVAATPFGLYPGLGLVLLAAFGLRRSTVVSRPIAKSILWLSGAVGLLLSLGLNLRIFGFQPYYWLWRYAPGFSHIRSPFRFGLLFQFALLSLALITLERLWRERRQVLVVGLVLLACLELLPRPESLSPELSQTQLSGVQSPAIFLPYPSGRSSSAYFQTTSWMLLAERSGFAIVNGYSGYFPSSHTRFKEELRNFPDAASLETLESQSVRTLILPTLWLEGERGAQISAWIEEGRLAPQGSQGAYSLFALPTP